MQSTLSWKDQPCLQVGLGVTTVLTMTTLINSVNAALPKISYMKSIDIYLFVCFFMVFGALIGTLHYTTLHYTTLHYTILHYTTLHCTTLHYTTLHYTSLRYTTLHYTTLQNMPVLSTQTREYS